MKKVLFISSTGGHFNELMQLKPLFKQYDYHIITEKDKTTENLKKIYKDKLNFLTYGIHLYLYLIVSKVYFTILKLNQK